MATTTRTIQGRRNIDGYYYVLNEIFSVFWWFYFWWIALGVLIEKIEEWNKKRKHSKKKCNREFSDECWGCKHIAFEELDEKTVKVYCKKGYW